MTFLRRLWLRIRAFFARASAGPPELIAPVPIQLEAPAEEFGPFQKLAAEESTHVVGMRNPKMTGRISATHPPRGRAIPHVHTPAETEAQRLAEGLPDRDAYHREREMRPGEMLECFTCGEWFPAEDIAAHDCDDALDEEAERRTAAGGSVDFDKAHSNVRYLDVEKRK